MTDHTIIDLPEIKLPRDLAWRVKFIDAVEEHVRHLGIAGHFQPPRFFGYYFVGRNPVVLARHWKVTLDATSLLWRLRQILERITENKFSIVAEAEEATPAYLLVHDRLDGSCWLWGFAQGRQFVEAYEPVAFGAAGENETVEGDGERGTKLLGP